MMIPLVYEYSSFLLQADVPYEPPNNLKSQLMEWTMIIQKILRFSFSFPFLLSKQISDLNLEPLSPNWKRNITKLETHL